MKHLQLHLTLDVVLVILANYASMIVHFAMLIILKVVLMQIHVIANQDILVQDVMMIAQLAFKTTLKVVQILALVNAALNFMEKLVISIVHVT